MLLTQNINKLVVYINIKGISVDFENKNEVLLTVNSGENWHEFVVWCISQNYGGLENLSLIPGHVGTSPIQNIGAYGVEVKDVITKVEGLYINNSKKFQFTNKECINIVPKKGLLAVFPSHLQHCGERSVQAKRILVGALRYKV